MIRNRILCNISGANGDGQGMWHVWGITEMHTGVCWGNLRERDHLEDLEVDRTIILKWILNIMGERGLY